MNYNCDLILFFFIFFLHKNLQINKLPIAAFAFLYYIIFIH